MGTAEERIAATVELIEQLREEEEIGTSVAGALLIALGAAEDLKAHPDCGWDTDYCEGGPQDWKDATGRVWDLNKTYVDGRGGLWMYAGGFQGDPDCQPLMSRRGYSERNVPLRRIYAANGGLEVAS